MSKPEVIQGSLERTAREAQQRKFQESHDLEERLMREEESRRVRERQMETMRRLDVVLAGLLRDPNSVFVASMTDCLNEEKEFGELSSEALAEWFTENLSLSAAHPTIGPPSANQIVAGPRRGFAPAQYSTPAIPRPFASQPIASEQY